ncbi:hypothetical protein Y032_0501g2609 [Ancylostoma ceylanicum]|uniref:Uncharacterized protein n=1 Tax=Ancylostoma ceylanicum TaxID=53326 RepID=A0A016WU40_9BILA|nr:hypothetical protein Y032_0501g2609 [Ancylostoma ceylanicum]
MMVDMPLRLAGPSKYLSLSVMRDSSFLANHTTYQLYFFEKQPRMRLLLIRICTREEGSQTDFGDLWGSSPETIKSELSRLLRTESFHSLVQAIQQLLPTLQSTANASDA